MNRRALLSLLPLPFVSKWLRSKATKSGPPCGQLFPAVKDFPIGSIVMAPRSAKLPPNWALMDGIANRSGSGVIFPPAYFEKVW